MRGHKIYFNTRGSSSVWPLNHYIVKTSEKLHKCDQSKNFPIAKILPPSFHIEATFGLGFGLGRAFPFQTEK